MTTWIDDRYSHNQRVVAMKAAVLVLLKWEASPSQICRVLGYAHSDYGDLVSGDVGDVDGEQLERSSYVLSIYAEIRSIFQNPVNQRTFMKMSNFNPGFHGRQPLELMAEGDLQSLKEILIALAHGAGEH